MLHRQGDENIGISEIHVVLHVNEKNGFNTRLYKDWLGIREASPYVSLMKRTTI